MAPVFSIMNMSWWCMGDHHMDTAFSPDGKPHAKDDFFHFHVRVLIHTAIVPYGALKAQNIQRFKPAKFCMNILTSHRVGWCVTDIVVSFYIQERFIKPVP